MISVSTRIDRVYEALDTAHHGYPLKGAKKETILKYREHLPDKLVLKVGARVVLRRNINIVGGWVNSTLAVISLHPSCIVIAKLANPAHKYPVSRFRQRIEIRGAFYSILRQQFPIQIAYYGVTVHGVQGCSVQKAVVCKRG